MRVVRNRNQPSRVRTLFMVALGVMFVLFLSTNGAARLYTDYLWYDNLNLSSVWQTLLGTKLALVAISTLSFFAILWANLYLVDRLAPEFRPESPEEDLIERYHDVIGANAGRVRIAVAAMFALIAGANTASEWDTWLMFRHGGSFGVSDPLFGKDAGFYVFRLPFWTFLVDWLFAALVFTLIITLVAHYLSGGIRAVSTTSRTTPSVKVHVSGILAGLAVLRAVAYFLDRFELVNDRQGAYDGALATDVQIKLPALNLLVLISLFGAVLFVVNIWRKGWSLPAVAFGLWAITHVVAAGIFPALYQRLKVQPDVLQQESAFITRNIEATRFAYGLDDSNLSREPFAYNENLQAQDLIDNAETLANVTVLDAGLAAEAFTKDQGQRKQYSFSPVLDIDSYEIDGQLQPVLLSVRGLNLSGVDASQDGWVKRHIAFTHGYAVAAAAGNRVERTGEPVFLVEGIGPELRIDESLGVTIDRPQIYFGEDLGGYAIVGARQDEIDYPATPEAITRYDGNGSVRIGGMLRRTAFSLRFAELNVLISGTVSSDSRVIYVRDVEDRVRALAPFLGFDDDPYPALVDGRIVWIIDAYTTTDRFPYAQSVNGSAVGQSGRVNYVRNSVKAVVDAYDGDVSFYVVDEQDPLIEAYQKSFPALFTPVSEASPGLVDHFRYPKDLFRVQSDIWTTYHVANPVQFLQDDLSWSIATQPSTKASGDGAGSALERSPMEPQYRVAELPGGSGQEFVLQRAFVPSGGSDNNTQRPELTGILVARKGENQGLVLYELPANRVSAMDLVDADIRKESEISTYITPLDLQGSEVRFGEMQLVLMADTLVYVRPLYVAGRGATSVPELNRVIAVNGDRIAMAPTLEEALARVTVDSPDDAPSTGSGNDGDGNGDDASDGGDSTVGETPLSDAELADLSVAQLIGLADEYLELADEAEQEGDSDKAADLRGEAQGVLARLSRVLGVEPVPPTQSGGA